jgi:large subunit ribosomal protein L20
MARVKRGTSHIKKRRKLLKQAKGYKWGRKKLIKLAKVAVTKAGKYQYESRRKKKTIIRQDWQGTINAAVRERGLTYSQFIDKLNKNKIELDRKILAQLALEKPEVFTKIVEKVK